MRWLALWVLLTGISISRPLAAQDATTLTVGVPFDDTVIGQLSERFYRVTPGVGEHLIVVLQKPSGFASRLDIKFKAMPTDISTDDTDGGENDGSDQAVEIGVTKAGDYFIRVRAECCDVGGSFTITALTRSTLPALSFGVPVSGDLTSASAERYYRVTLSASQHLFVLLEKPSAFASRVDINFKSLPTSANTDASDGGDRDASDQVVEIRLTKAGDYFVRVAAACCDAGGSYTITAHDLTTLPVLTDGAGIIGNLPRRLAERYYRVPMAAGGELVVNLTKAAPFAANLDIKFSQLPTDGDSDASDGGNGLNLTVDIPTTKAGNYFVRVRGACCDAGGDYTIGTAILAPLTCLGDCTGGNDVTVNELLTMVNIALGNAQIAACTAGDANGDGEITINELLVAVSNALNGCR
jgi:hypothetical protein